MFHKKQFGKLNKVKLKKLHCIFKISRIFLFCKFGILTIKIILCDYATIFKIISAQCRLYFQDIGILVLICYVNVVRKSAD